VVFGAGAVAVGFISCALVKAAAVANKTADNPNLPTVFIFTLPAGGITKLRNEDRLMGISSSTTD
jgi:hypothetical protein